MLYVLIFIDVINGYWIIFNREHSGSCLLRRIFLRLLFQNLILVFILCWVGNINHVSAQDKVVLQLHFDHQFQFAGYYAAQWKGFYKEAGLNVDIRSGMRSDGSLINVMEELKSGRIDFGIAAGDALIARANGVPLVLLASIFQQSGVEVFALPKARLLSPADLPRLRVQNGNNHLLDLELIAMLEAEGIDPKTVPLLSMPPPYTIQSHFDRLFKGEVDATLAYSLSILWYAKERNIALTRLRPSAYGVDFYGDSLFAHRGTIEKDHEMVERFVAASLKGWQYAMEHPDEIAAEIAVKLPCVLPVSNSVAYNRFLAGRVKQLTMFPVVRIGHINPERWETMNDSMKLAGLVNTDLDIDTFIFDPKGERAAQLQRRYWIIFIALTTLVFALVAYAVIAQIGRRRERRRTLNELRDSERRLRTILDTEPECVKVVSADGKLLEMNRAGLAMLEACSLTEAQQYPLIEFIEPDYREAFGNFHQKVLRGENDKLVFKIKGLKGKNRWLETHATPLHEDKEVMMLGVTRDITEKKQAEEALQNKEEQLQQMQKMEAIGRLAGGVAHDFNNLLTAINGYSDLVLLKIPPTDSLRVNVLEIKKAGERAADLTKQLLAFSRKQMMQPKVINLNYIVTDVSKMLDRLINENISVSTILAPDLGQVKADPGQIGQVIVNLAVNARDAMPNGGRLTIETANVILDEEYAKHHVAVTPGFFVMLAVSDTGIGIDKETQERIFEPFFTTKATGTGTGLGLSTVHGIVSQSGGNIRVYSEVGKGTTFKVYLPRVKAEVEQTQSYPMPQVLPQGTETVLLVEDNEMVRDITSTTLKMQGYKVLEVSSGKEAISVCEQFEDIIHLLLTDVVMPEMSGSEVAEQIKLIRPDIKVLYISGYTEDAIVHHGVLDDGIEFLEKPFTPDSISRKVREVLDK